MRSWAIERARAGLSAQGLGAVLALGLGCAALPAAAQNTPTSLLPPPNPPTVILSPSAAASGTSPGASPQAAPAAADQPINGTAPSAATVQAQQLQSPDVNGFGLLDPGNGGLPADFWSGTDAALADRLLTLLKPSVSAPMQRLARAVLLSSATPPAPVAGSPPPAEPFLARRAETLWALGRADDLATLLKTVPAPAQTPGLRRLQADNALLAGDSATACAQAPLLIAASATDAYPVELRVYCQLAAKQASQAGLGIDVLREEGTKDSDFFALADALAGTVPAPKRAIAPSSPLILAMARMARAEIADPGAAAQPMVLRAVALVAGASLDARLAAGERAEAVGAIDADTLRRLYESAPFTSDELAQAESKAATLPAARAHAMLYQAAGRQTAALAKAGLIAKALALADGPAYFSQARVYGPMIATLQPSTDIAIYAPALARALLAAHQFDAARNWLGWLRAQAVADKSASGAAAALIVQARIAGLADSPLAPDAVKAWQDAAPAGLAADKAARRNDLAFALLAALGDPVPADALLGQLDTATPAAGQASNAALALAFDAAVANKRLGEIILESYIMLGDGSLTQIGSADLARIVGALAAAGLKDDARALALDAAIANGA